MTDDLKNILRELRNLYLSVYGDALVKVLLYGSYARGNNEKDSDIDVVAIVDGDRKRLQELLKQVWDRTADMELKYDTLISPTVIPLSEYEKYKTTLPYYHNIENEGVLIVA